ncbi:GDP-mannose 4,6-dehydratase [Herpetosiphon sp. NSE202]|uniref:GDP-mannose 4,6-dehydratase n=1 Tax=Herpetosiphon sp. NSE202 TaxID=3351349 RepID=UPI0036379736
MTYLVTGGAGFIGSHLCETLLQRGERVIAFDNFNDYYSPERKRRNVADLLKHPNFVLWEGDLRDPASLLALFEHHRPSHVAHLAGMANPRYSLQHPALYSAVNVEGSVNVWQAAIKYGIQAFVQASTSSVYGLAPTPWHEALATDQPLSPYAATKKAAELLAYTFHYQSQIPTRVVRFFTVYGPKGRPDMTPTIFVEAMRKQEPIVLYNGGVDVYRDWTYVDDIVSGVIAVLDSDRAFDIFNLGNSTPVMLRSFIDTLQAITGIEAIIEAKPLSSADPPITFADTSKAQQLLGWKPTTDIEDGLERYWHWYKSEYDC